MPSIQFTQLLAAICEHPNFDQAWAWPQLAHLVLKDGSRTSEIGRVLHDNSLYWSTAPGMYKVRFDWPKIIEHGLLPRPLCPEFLRLCRAVQDAGDEAETFSYRRLARLFCNDDNDSHRAQIARLILRHRCYVEMPVAAQARFRWDLIQLEPPPERDLVEELLEALEHETQEAWRAGRENPQRVKNVRHLVDNALRGDCYRGQLEDREDEDPVPFLEGMPVLVEWTRGQPIAATLLVYDTKTLDVVLEFSQPQAPNDTCKIYPDRSRLLSGYTSFVERLRENRLAMEVIAGKGPLSEPFNGAINDSTLREGQEEVVRSGLANKVLFLWGPPGTGKTYTLAGLIAELALRGERVLATSISNQAVDELAQDVYERLMGSAQGRALLKSGRALRLGFPSQKILKLEELFPHRAEFVRLRQEIIAVREARENSEDPEEVPRLTQRLGVLEERFRGVVKASLGVASVVFTTVAQVALIREFRACDPLSQAAESNTTPFDSVICDEASMMNLMHLIPVCWWTRKRVVIAGDPRQLGPVVASRSRLARKHLHRSLFDVEMAREEAKQRVLQLSEQSRMHESICALVSNAFYRGGLCTLPSQEHEYLPPLMRDGRTRAGIVPIREGEVRMTRSGSHYNEGEALVVMDLVSLLRKENEKLLPQIGIVTAYRAQAGIIRRHLRDAGWEKDSRIQVGTVHAFQGGEATVIIWNLVDTRRMFKPDGQEVAGKPGKLFNDEKGGRLANVAISRARAGLYVVGDFHLFMEHPPNHHLRSILLQVEAEGHVWRPNQLERDWQQGVMVDGNSPEAETIPSP